MSKVKEAIEKKLTYYNKQKDRAMTAWMENAKQPDRLSAIRCTERCKAYQEVIEILNAEK